MRKAKSAWTENDPVVDRGPRDAAHRAERAPADHVLVLEDQATMKPWKTTMVAVENPLGARAVAVEARGEAAAEHENDHVPSHAPARNPPHPQPMQIMSPFSFSVQAMSY
jgi:hypothetical protein